MHKQVEMVLNVFYWKKCARNTISTTACSYWVDWSIPKLEM